MLDGDLGFMFALSQELGQRQIAAFPSRTVMEAESLLRQFHLEPAALVIDCSRPKACPFADRMVREQPGVQVVAIVSDRYRCAQCSCRPAAQFQDPEDRAPERIAYVAEVIEMLVRKQRRRAHRAGSSH